jgi:threonine dehydrogenase-like Zn-dependent dehydrogenase
MRALVCDKQVRLDDARAEPTVGQGEALLAVHLAGVCRTDLEVTRGYSGFRGVMGHEFVGRVESGPAALIGRRVVGEINCPCRQCSWCRQGLGNHCPHRTVIGIVGRDGCFAERLALPIRNLHAVPDNISDELAAWTEPLAAAFQIPRQLELKGRRTVLLGDGRLAQLIARVLRPRVGTLLVVGKHEDKLALAADAGAETVLLADYQSDRSAEVVIDATGRAEGLTLAMRAVRPRGTIVLKSTVAAGAQTDLSPLVVDEIRLIGSRCGPFDDALGALAGGEVDLSSLPVQTIPLTRAPDALAAAEGGETMKVLIDARA